MRDALSSSIGVLVREAGGVPRSAAIVPDDQQRLQAALTDAVATSDCVVICAGSSVGGRDETAAAVAALSDAEIWCHGLAIKPGKPTLLARGGEIPIIGLPGNPRSALVIFRTIGMPLVRRVGGWTAEPRRRIDPCTPEPRPAVRGGKAGRGPGAAATTTTPSRSSGPRRCCRC